MANPVKGETLLTLADGRQFTIVMDMEALIEAEQAYGKPMAQMMADANRGFISALRALVFGAMRAHHPQVTLAEATAVLMAEQAVVAAALLDAVKLAFPDAAAGGEGKKPGKALPPRRAGKTSGASGAKRA